MRPAGFVAGRRYPTLLNIHGGPHTQYGHNFFDEFQVYAGAGYAVVYTNPRGSQGYGEAFAQAVVGDWGGGDYADVMAALDEAIAPALVHRPGSARRARRKLRRVPHELDRRAHATGSRPRAPSAR